LWSRYYLPGLAVGKSIDWVLLIPLNIERHFSEKSPFTNRAIKSRYLHYSNKIFSFQKFNRSNPFLALYD